MLILLILIIVFIILGIIEVNKSRKPKIKEIDKSTNRQDPILKKNNKQDLTTDVKLSSSEVKKVDKDIVKPKTFNTTVVDPNYNPLVLKVRPKVLTYDDLLKDERWKAKALKIKQRDDFCCRYCRSILNLQVHHKYYSKYPDGTKVMPWNYPDDALITLCEYCHKRVHQTKKIKVYYRKYSDNY